MSKIARRQLLETLVLAAPIALTTQAVLAQSSEAQLLVDRARIVVQQFQNDPGMKDMHVYVQNAYGVMVFPDVLKGGFVIGAEYGSGVMLLRDVRTGAFGEPAFFTIASGSLGLQIGGKSSDVILTFMNDGAVQKLLNANFKIGTDASATAGTVGGGVGAATTVQFGEDIYIFAKEQGLFAGLSLDGSAIKPKDAFNKSYYGRAILPQQILRDRAATNPGSQDLRQALARF